MKKSKTKRTNYEKSSKKGEPTTIRFEKDKMEFLLEKENLQSVQQGVDFLLDNYWWVHKKANAPSETELPSTFVKDFATVKTKSIGKQVVGQNRIMMPNFIEIPPQDKSPVQFVNQYDAYESEIKSANSYEELAAIKKEIKSDKQLKPVDRVTLEALITIANQNLNL